MLQFFSVERSAMYRLVIFLDNIEIDALKTLALKEYRDVRSQAALLLKEGLLRRQLLPLEANSSQYPDHASQNKLTNNQTNKEEEDEKQKEQPPAD